MNETKKEGILYLQLTKAIDIDRRRRRRRRHFSIIAVSALFFPLSEKARLKLWLISLLQNTMCVFFLFHLLLLLHFFFFFFILIFQFDDNKTHFWSVLETNESSRINTS